MASLWKPSVTNLNRLVDVLKPRGFGRVGAGVV